MTLSSIPEAVEALRAGRPVIVSDDPLSAVANGTGVFLNNIDELSRVAADF